MGILRDFDPEIADAISNEIDRQAYGIELIASENFVSRPVLEAMGSVMTNKYAEGYPGRRYYGGCEFVDDAERLARDRAKELFGAERANVQPHSGTQANMAAFFACCEAGDTVMGQALAHGGHLSHGHPVNFSGRFYNVVQYEVHPETHRLDYDKIRELAKENQPTMIMCGASAYPRVIDFETLGGIADEVGAKLVADIAHIAGLVAVGLHPSPIPHAYYTTTTTHKTLRGPRGGLILTHKKGYKTLQKNVFPGIQGGPLMHVIAAKAVAFKEALRPEFKEYQQRILDNAQALAQALQGEGFKLVTDGTDNHLMLIDLRSKKLTGKDFEEALERAGITVNKNTVPFDPESPFVTSGVRVGTPAVTTRGFGPEEMKIIAGWFSRVAEAPTNEDVAETIKGEVKELCARFPLYENLVV